MATKEKELTSYRIEVMEKNIVEFRDEMRLGFDRINAKLDGLDSKYPSMKEHFENREKIKELEGKVEKINGKIAMWSGSLLILAFLAQQLFDKLWK